MKTYRPEAKGAVKDAMATTLGQASCFLASLIFSIFVPRYLGAANFGEWMLFRGLAIFWLALFTLGDREVISSFYLPKKTSGDLDGASRIYKSLVVFRLSLLPVSLIGSLIMLWSSTSIFRTTDAAWCMAASLIVKSLQANFNTLIFGQRRLGWIAILDTMQAIAVPVFLLMAFADGNVAMLPRAAVAADLLVFVSSFLLSRWWREWRPGWLTWSEWWEIMRYAGAISLAASVIVSLNNLLPYLMNVRGYSGVILGLVGLSLRCAWIAQSGLTAVATALMPALATVQVQHGSQRMFRWQDFVSRLGLAMLLVVTGNLVLLGPALVRKVWGPDFAGITPLLVGSLMAMIPIWLGSQWVRQFLLQRNTRVFIYSALLYAVTLGAMFFALPMYPDGWTPVVALCCAGSAMAIYTGIHAARNGATISWLPRFLPAVCWLAAAWYVGGSDRIDLRSMSVNLIWSGGCIAFLLIAGALRYYEVKDLWLSFRSRPVG